MTATSAGVLLPVKENKYISLAKTSMYKKLLQKKFVMIFLAWQRRGFVDIVTA
jgi:hypothetical protein